MTYSKSLSISIRIKLRHRHHKVLTLKIHPAFLIYMEVSMEVPRNRQPRAPGSSCGSRRPLPCRGAPSPHTSPRSALGSSPGRLSAEPCRRQSPCPGTQPLGHSRDPALHHSPGHPAAAPAAQPAADMGHGALRAVLCAAAGKPSSAADPSPQETSMHVPGPESLSRVLIHAAQPVRALPR